MKRVLALVVALLVAPPALAGDLSVRVGTLSSAEGRLIVAVCTEAEFLKVCRLTSGVAARAGTLTVQVAAVPPGRYAVQVYHDQNGNSRLDTNMLGIPTEPYGLSRNPSTRLRAPTFEETAIDVGSAPQSLSITMRGT